MRFPLALVIAALGAVACADDQDAAVQAARAGSRGLSSADYDAWRRPDRVVAALALAPGHTVADVGAGNGYFTRRLARAVGPRGHVTATDIDARALAELAQVAREPAVGTPTAPIEVRRVEADDPGLEPRRYDRILVAQVDHLLADRVDYLLRLRRALAPGGRVAVANRIQHRAALLRAADSAGYSVAADVTDLPGQFLVLLDPHPTSSTKVSPSP